MFLRGKEPITTFAQKLPFVRHHHRQFLLLLMFAMEQLDMSELRAGALGQRVDRQGRHHRAGSAAHLLCAFTRCATPGTCSISICDEAKLDKGFKGMLARWMLHTARASGICAPPTAWTTTSRTPQFIARRIWKVYRREATVIHPPVDVDNFALRTNKDPFYLTASRMVPYKKITAIVEAFRALPDRKLVVDRRRPGDAAREGAGGPECRDPRLSAVERAVAISCSAHAPSSSPRKRISASRRSRRRPAAPR